MDPFDKSGAGMQAHVQQCLAAAVTKDPLYAVCLAQSGLVNFPMPKVFPSGAFDVGNGMACTQFDLDDPTPECCMVVNRASTCHLTHDDFEPDLVKCKQLLDRAFDSFPCSLDSWDIFGIILASTIFFMLVALRVIITKKSNRAPLWTAQLWALFVKNYYIWKSTVIRQVLLIVLPSILIGALVVLLQFTDNTESTKSFMQFTLTYSTPGESRKQLLINLQPVAGLFFLIALTYPIAQAIMSIMLEKELQIREAMRLTGLFDAPLIISWIVSYLVSMSPLSLCLSILTHYGGLFPDYSILFLFVFFSIFLSAMVAFILALSAFFTETRPAIVGILVCAYLLHFAAFASTKYNNQVLMCLSAPTCLAVSMSAAFQRSSLGSLYRFADFIQPSNQLSMGTATFIMLADVFLYSIIACYLDKVLPQKYGTRLPWHFPFHIAYWTRATRSIDHQLASITTSRHRSAVLEEASDATLDQLVSQKRCVTISGMTKQFHIGGNAPDRLAVNNISLTLYEGHITSVLGHNGAGKTTLIAMLAGLIDVTCGNATMFGYSLNDDIASIRRFIGMCPQHDVLYLDLSVYQNLRLFAMLKGVPRDDTDAAINDILAELGLSSKLHGKARTLSGGQKRKLCVAIALVTHSQIHPEATKFP